MASTVNLSSLTKYIDQLNQDILREAVLLGTTFTGPNPVTTRDGIKNGQAINLITSTLVITPDGCPADGSIISASGSVTLSQQTIQICPMQLIETVCEVDLEAYWTGMLMPLGSYVQDLEPKALAKVYLADKTEKLSAFLDDLFWEGSTSGTYSNDANLKQCNGLLYQLDSTSATSSVVSGNTIIGSASSYSGALTTANAITIVNNMIQNMTANVPAILGKKDKTLFMSYANFQTCLFAWQAFNGFHIELGQTDVTTTTNDQYFYWPGTTILVKATRGLSYGVANGNNKMVLTYAENLFFGTDKTNDQTSGQLWWENLANKMYYRAAFKAGAQVAYPQYVVYYKG
jgi:hypothetical protein